MRYNYDSKLRIIELCSGLGSQTEALKRLGIKHEVVMWADIDPKADVAYEMLHNPKVDNSGDMYKIEELPECELMVYSTPCTDFSMAGLRKGADEGSGTRSAVIWEIVRYLDNYKKRNCLPKYLLLENVKGLVTQKFLPFFNSWLDRLKNEYGYNNYYKVQNAKHFNVPQNRERVMAVSIREDVDNGLFEFPEERPCQVKLKDILEKEVDERFYISQRAIDGIMHSNYNRNSESFRIQNKHGESRTLTARDWKDPMVVTDNYPQQLGMLRGEPYNKMFEQSRRFYSEEGVAPTQHCCGGGHLETKVGVGVEVNAPDPICFAMRGRNPENPSDRQVGSHTEQRLEMNSQGTTNTLTTVGKDNLIGEPQIMSQIAHGFNKGYVKEIDIVPPLTSHGYQENNHIHEEQDIDCIARVGFGKYAPISVAPCQTTKSGANEQNSSAVLKFELQENKCIAKVAFSKYAEVDLAPTQTANSNGSASHSGTVLKIEPLNVKDGTMYNPYNNAEIIDVAPTQTANCSSTTSSAMVAKFEEVTSPIEDEIAEENDEWLMLYIAGGYEDGYVMSDDGKKPGYYFKDGKFYKVRKLTPKESFRLMGWEDERIEPLLTAVDAKGKRIIPDSACYFLCGNSIVIQHLMAIFGQLFRVRWKKKVFGTDENHFEDKQIGFLDMVKPDEELYENWPELVPIKSH